MSERVKITKRPKRKLRIRESKPPRAEAYRITFTDLTLKRLNIKKRLGEINARRKQDNLKPVHQFVVWDEAQRGLSLLCSGSSREGTKTFRVTFKLHDQWKSDKIGRFGEMEADKDQDKENLEISEARKIAASYRAMARQGIDPTAQKVKASKLTYEAVVDDFIKQYAKPRQRTWDATERVLKVNCAAWLKRPIASITGGDVRALLRGFKDDEGKMRKAGITKSWLKTFWKWAYHEEKVASPLIQGIDNVEIEKGSADRIYSDAEIKATWNAANKLTPIERDFVKLMILLAPRKTALAASRRSHIKEVPLMSGDRNGQKVTTLVTPFELTKSKKSTDPKRVKRRYLTPLPSLTQRIIKGIAKNDKDPDLLFPGMRLYRNKKTDQLQLHGIDVARELSRLGAPKDFTYKAWRHTITTWLQDHGYSEHDRGLILNHSGSGTVTDDYSHGYPLALKLEMLEKWAAHIESIVGVKGAALLR